MSGRFSIYPGEQKQQGDYRRVRLGDGRSIPHLPRGAGVAGD